MSRQIITSGKQIISIILSILLVVALVPVVMFATDRIAPTKAMAEGYNGTNGDISNWIENVTTSWVTQPTDSNLVISPTDNDLQSMQYKVEMALSGQNVWPAGSVKIRIPRHPWTDRDGSPTGSYATLPVVASPGSSTDGNGNGWNYFVDGLADEYVITNTTPLPAATQGFFTFTIQDIRPSDIVDGASTAPITAKVEVETPAGTPGAMESSPITASMDTSVKVTAASKAFERNSGGGVLHMYTDLTSKAKESFDATGKDSNEYVFVKWLISGGISANQPYTYEITDTIPNNTLVQFPGSFLLPSGESEYDTQKSGDGSTQVAIAGASKTKSTNKNIRDGFNAFRDIYMAIPVNTIPLDTEVYVYNSVTYKATGIDDGVTTEKSTTASANFTRPSGTDFGAPPGDYWIKKQTADLDKLEPTNKYLLSLNNGNDVEISYTLLSGGYLSRWVLPSGITKEDFLAGNYTAQEVTLETIEDVTYLDGDWHTDLTIDDVYIRRMYFYDMSLYKHSYNEALDTWHEAVNANNMLGGKDVPVEVWGTDAQTGQWVKYATFTYTSGSSVASSGNNSTISDLKVFNGASIIDNPGGAKGITFPDDAVLRTKLVTTVGDAGAISLQTGLVQVLKASSDKVQEMLERRLTPEAEHNTVLRNDATLVVYYANGNQASPQVTGEDIVAIGSRDYMQNYNPELDSNRRTIELDAIKYEKEMYHDYSYVYLSGDLPQTEAHLDKKLLRSENYPATSSNRLEYHVAASMQFNDIEYYDDTAYYMAIDELGLDTLSNRDGVFYDLLPKGSTLVNGSVKVGYGAYTPMPASINITNVTTISNYKNSGRTLLIVEYEGDGNNRNAQDASMMDAPWIDYSIPTPPKIEAIEIAYQVDLPWSERTINGGNTVNNAAFQLLDSNSFGNVSGATGEPDNPTAGNHNYSGDAVRGVEDIMTDLDPSSDKPTFVYAKASTSVTGDTMAMTGLGKTVRTDEVSQYTKGLLDEKNTKPDGSYSYRITMSPVDPNTAVKNMVFFDSLENFVPQAGEDTGATNDLPQWKGTFQNVDVSALEAKGAHPVVYYSTVENLDIRAHQDLSEGVWTIQVPANPADVRAIAIDLGDFELNFGEVVGAYIWMKAPDADAAEPYLSRNIISAQNPAHNGHAYNETFMSATVVNKATGVTSDNFTEEKFTKVGIYVPLEDRWIEMPFTGKQGILFGLYALVEVLIVGFGAHTYLRIRKAKTHMA